MDKNRSKAKKILPVEGRENMAETDTVTCEDGCLQDASGGRGFLFTLFHHSFGDSRGLKSHASWLCAFVGKVGHHPSAEMLLYQSIAAG